ncbi:hypothetical protein ABL78_7854 [Leptomonas seymouri]|uniref:SAM-dependent MTase RsmB/NOP-type domain-containing protein n=1 Tax=Leptomonas seymouri TaxID=5684 RepID=A0A0N1PA86_LEPSE|nr:hypothetical protein ABL78_7854 [Leptomonas seymouri]|eukprot:KPI83122.1 hypothetical protein ABL78_7854 [Leptomonas seymouri]
MITLDTYAHHVYQYASASTTEHLRRTVWEPLGLAAKSVSMAASPPPSSHASLYAVPPITTNIRCIGANIEEKLQHLVRTATDAAEASMQCAAEGLSPPPGTAASARYTPPSVFSALGLPFCGCVYPRINLLAPWPPSFSLSTLSATRADPSQAPLVVVVDARAAEAVLRGSDLYAPGVVTASRAFLVGEEALVAFYVERVLVDADDSSNGGTCTESPKRRQKVSKGEDGAAAAHRIVSTSANKAHERAVDANAACWRIVSSLSAGITLAPELYTPLLRPDETTAASLAQRPRFLVCVGRGTLVQGWKDVLGRRSRGVALRTDWTPQLQPSRATLRSLLNITGPTSTPVSPPPLEAVENGGKQGEPDDVFFLQNYSSMVPVSLLVDHLSEEAFQRSCTVLDACAGPGGKTSLLLSLLQARAEKEGLAEQLRDHSARVPFRVVCCERSRPRQEQLMQLLRQHFSSSAQGIASHGYADESDLSRVLEPHCSDTNKYLKELLAANAAGPAAAAAPPPPFNHTNTFDAILLDPPCTGLGLRPKLLPHIHSIASIQQSADYQRKLFDSCVRHLRCTPTSPGVLVYSTCTTTLEENEANVLHFLRAYPSLRLARASTPAHHVLGGLSVTTYPRPSTEAAAHNNDAHDRPSLPTLLLSQEILSLQREKEISAAALSASPVPPSSDAPLLALRFMPRALQEYDRPSEDSVGFFVAVFLCYGHDD